jgi:transposase
MIRLSDEQWERIRKHFPEEHVADDGPGRKPIPTRRVLEAVLWILKTGAQWHMLPQSYPNYKTVHRRFQTWCSNVPRGVLTDVANELRDTLTPCHARICTRAMDYNQIRISEDPWLLFVGTASAPPVADLRACRTYRRSKTVPKKTQFRGNIRSAQSILMAFPNSYRFPLCKCCLHFVARSAETPQPFR